jgi:hypothetical protein
MPIQPTTCKLTNGCQQQFTLAGAAGAITWAIVPAGVGQFLSPGLYQAPDPITAPAQVTIRTTMGGVTESATVKLVPPEVILAPAGKVTLTTGQTQQFIATVPGDPANQVQWTLAPTVGAIAGGVYTPPTRSVVSPPKPRALAPDFGKKLQKQLLFNFLQVNDLVHAC